MSFAEKIRIVKFKAPRVDVIISDALASGVEFDAEGNRGMDYTSPTEIPTPPTELSQFELLKLAERVLGEMGYMGSPNAPYELTQITDGNGTVMPNGTLLDAAQAYADTFRPAGDKDEPAGPFAEAEVRGWHGDDLKIVAETKLPKPDTKARGKVTIHRLLKITDSEVIAHVGYDAGTCTLEVGIKKVTKASVAMSTKRGAKKRTRTVTKKSVIRYRFKDVPKEIFVGIATAESAGLYFNGMVKPHYIGRRVPG